MKNSGFDPANYDDMVSSFFIFILLIATATFMVEAYSDYRSDDTKKSQATEQVYK